MAQPAPPPAGLQASAVAARATELTKVYGAGETRVVALESVSVEFGRGRFTAIMGPSGSGKSTLMHCMAGLDSFSGGSARIADTELSRLGDRRLTRLRREKVGFVFQSFNLPPRSSSRTSRPATSTPGPAPSSWTSCGRRYASWDRRS